VEGLRARVILPLSEDGWAKLLDRLFDLASLLAGKAGARRLFIEAGRRGARRTKQARGSAKHHRPGRDQWMLTVHKRALETARKVGCAEKHAVGIAAQFLHEEDPQGYGHSRPAIEKHIRRLLRKKASADEALTRAHDDDAALDDAPVEGGTVLLSGLRPRDK